jgi:hypothetical protein
VPQPPGFRRSSPLTLATSAVAVEAGTPAAVSTVTAAERPASCAVRRPSFTASITAKSVCSCTYARAGAGSGELLLGSLLATSYGNHLGDTTAGSKLPANALDTAQDSVGAGYAVAQGIGDKAHALAAQAAQATDPRQAAQLRQQAAELASGARQTADAVGSSFSAAVAHTSLVGAVILGIGTVLVAVLLPRREAAAPEAKTEEKELAHSSAR